MADENKKRTGLKIVLTVLCLTLALILALMIGVTVWAESMMNQVNRKPSVEETLSDEEIRSILDETDPIEDDYTGLVLEEDVTLATEPAEMIEEKDEIINILLIGQDRRPGQGRQRSDSMILCTVNLEKKTLVMTSFLRDLYVELPEWNGKHYLNNRLNATYAFGGMGLLDETLKLNFGITVDHNVEVDFTGFEQIVDLMGGVDINLTAAEARVLGEGTQAGVNHLDGVLALRYAQIRKLDSDFGRTDRQRKVLTALLEKAKHMNASELTELVNSFLPTITTDMSNEDIVRYVAKILPVLTELEVTTQYIPAQGSYRSAMIRGMAVLVPDMEEARQLLKDTLG